MIEAAACAACFIVGYVIGFFNGKGNVGGASG